MERRPIIIRMKWGSQIWDWNEAQNIKNEMQQLIQISDLNGKKNEFQMNFVLFLIYFYQYHDFKMLFFFDFQFFKPDQWNGHIFEVRTAWLALNGSTGFHWLKISM